MASAASRLAEAPESGGRRPPRPFFQSRDAVREKAHTRTIMRRTPLQKRCMREESLDVNRRRIRRHRHPSLPLLSPEQSRNREGARSGHYPPGRV